MQIEMTRKWGSNMHVDNKTEFKTEAKKEKKEGYM